MIRQARKAWKSAVPLNKKDWDTTNARFSEVMDRFRPHLERKRQQGIQFREELIRKAEALDGEPIKVAIEKAKSYQSEWNSVAIRARKKQENQLWNDFKQACDRQFQRRSDLRKGQELRRQESKAECQSLLEEIKTINQRADSEIKQAAAQVADIQQRWKQANAFGSKKSDIATAFNHELSQFRRSMKKAKRVEMEQMLSVLEQKADICNALELSIGQANTATMIAANQKKWDTIEQTCGEHEASVQARYAAACKQLQNASAIDQSHAEQSEKNHAIKKNLCLQLEVLTEIDSPAEFARDRMAYNVDRLNAVMTRQTSQTDSNDEINALLVQYWLTAAVPEEHHQAISDRFKRIRSKLRQD